MDPQDPTPTEEKKLSNPYNWIPEEPVPVNQVNSAKFMVWFTVALFGFILFMALMLQLATNDR
jgi:hypothetical protein